MSAPRQDKRAPQVGRGALKLQAALARFNLAGAVVGGNAVDVGASTGGFTQVLLDHGAAKVLCVDAGHGQLHESLRADPRVQNLEQTDWKRLSLSARSAAGPFDFFTVDVSFVAARNMLRGLAFRVRPGAEGVVLIKPQFELPDHLVRGGDVTDPRLRQQAVGTFTRKAESLGFRVVQHIDSPVPGGEGTIEILAHLRFEGRPDNLPQPGEQRPHRVRVPKGRAKGSASALSGALEWFAVVTPGAEEVALHEALALFPGVKVRLVPGGLEWRGDVTTGMRSNLHLRIPTRVLLRLGAVRAREFGKLRHLLAHLPWEAFLPPGGAVRITVTTSHCRLYHTGAIDEAVRAAIADRTGSAPEKPDSAAADAALVLVRGVDDTWTISVDSSGERLHKRGWRTESGDAPLRESLAATLLALAEWKPEEALVDPMCGAGTIAIEASTVALGMAPGLRRSFAFERWPALIPTESARWESLRQAAASQRRDTLPAAIVASDRDAAAVAATRNNAARVGVASLLTIAERPLSDAVAPAQAGLVIANPPYGERLGLRRDLPGLYRDFGRVMRIRFPGWRAAVVVPDARLASAFRMPVSASHTVRHGGLRVTLLRFAPSARV